MMRVVAAVAGAAFLTALAIGASSAVAQAQQAPAGGGKVDAAEVYKMRCAVCHAADGNSPMPNMSFADGVWKHGATVAAVTKTITEGVPGTAMMPMKAQLSKEEIAALARYVRKFDKKLK